MASLKIKIFTFILVMLKNPALQPTSIPPGNVSFGIEKYEPSFKVLAPYDIHEPSFSKELIDG
jgi:hypothetical protein